MTKKRIRDEFSDETKRLASERVGLRCSICGVLTKAASVEGPDKVVNVGIAAHICAAAPKGPRYDPSMSSEQRKSIENCIWTCTKHGKIIDNEPSIYTREYLINKKREAEERAAKALKDGESDFIILRSGGFDIQQTKRILEDTLISGDYLKLKCLLDSLSIEDESDELQDLYSYFSIVYAFYCDRSEIDKLLKLYFTQSQKRYVNNIVELFIQFEERDLLQKVIGECADDDLKSLATLVIENKLEGTIFSIKKENVDENIQSDFKAGSLIHKLLTNIAIEHNIDLLCCNGKIIPLYEGEFYYRQKILVLKIYRKYTESIIVNNKKLPEYPEYKLICEQLEKVKVLIPTMQMYLWKNLLLCASQVGDGDSFDKLYAECSGEIKNNIVIRERALLNEIEKDVALVNVTDVRKACDELNRYDLFHIYISKLTETNPIEAEKILSSHSYLLTTDCYFLEDYIRIKHARGKTNFSAVKFITEYESFYRDNYIYHILLAFNAGNNKKYQVIFSREVKWIVENIQEINDMHASILERLIEVYRLANLHERLLDIDALNPPIYFRMRIAGYLQETSKYLDGAKKIYIEILKGGHVIDNLYRGLYLCSYKMGELSEALQYLYKQINVKPVKEDYINLLLLKLEIKDYTFDKYVEQAKEFKDPKIYFLIGSLCSQMNRRYEEIRYYFLESLLMDANNIDCLHSFFALNVEKVNENPPQKIEAGITIDIEMNGKFKSIAIHEDIFRRELFPCNFANITHFRVDDRSVEDLLLRKENEEALFKGKKCKIVRLNWTDTMISAYAIRKLSDTKRIQIIQGSVEQSVDQIINILNRGRRHDENIINKYNESKSGLPITMLSNALGRKIIETYSFLFYENKKHFRNLDGRCPSIKDCEFILSFDTLYLLAILDVDSSLLVQLNCKITMMTKRKLLSELDEFIRDCNNGMCAGRIFIKEGAIYRDENNDNKRRAQLKFFNRFKSLVESLPCADKIYPYNRQDELRDIFIKEKLYLEADLIGYVDSHPNAIIVNDDVFMSSYCVLNKMKAIGMNNFLTLLDHSVVEHVDHIQQLAQLNFGNYITPDVYSHIKSLILSEIDEEKRNNAIAKFYNFLTGKFLEENCNLWKYHCEIVREIARSNNITPDCRGTLDYLVIRAITYLYSIENPEEFKKKVEDIQRRFRVKYYEKDGEIVVETYMIDEEAE